MDDQYDIGLVSDVLHCTLRVCQRSPFFLLNFGLVSDIVLYLYCWLTCLQPKL